jgi:hypothetical protein
MPDPRETYGRVVHETRLACEADQAAAEGRHKFDLKAWEKRTDWQRELDMRIGPAVAARAVHDAGFDHGVLRAQVLAARAERDRAVAKVARLEAALRRHTYSFTDSRGTVLCGGCLREAPCPDAGLAGDEPS